ncbi:MAG TPA: GGDEF domain-containing protein [Steroidobacteraceae bacterium]|nr:GGDEF domain-containing protein [Steroidobacteraceae bacterium]
MRHEIAKSMLYPIFAARTRVEPKQRLRLRRFAEASIFSVAYLLLLAIFHAEGKVDRETLFEACAIVATLIFGLFLIFHLGLNLRFPDPSLTVVQVLAAVSTMLFVFYRAPESRLVFTPCFFIALMFGMLRCSGAKLAVLGLVSLSAFALVIWRRYGDNNDVAELRLDILQFVVIATTFPWLVFLGGRVKRLQRNLLDMNIKMEDVEQKVYQDDLTGIHNRRGILVAMQDSRRRADATGEPFSVCVIDLDLFKRYNDEFDHLTGDRVLQTFVQAARNGLRSTDVFGRYGGDEFVQILPQTALSGAVLDAERLRDRISMLHIPLPRSMDQLTVSIGVAQYRSGETINQTFARADEALYRAKQMGRNRVECGCETPDIAESGHTPS